MATAVQSNPNGQVQENPAGGSGPAVKGMSRTASGADLHDRAQAQYHPVDKLGKILAKKCDDERGINGVTGDFASPIFGSFGKLFLVPPIPNGTDRRLEQRAWPDVTHNAEEQGKGRQEPSPR